MDAFSYYYSSIKNDVFINKTITKIYLDPASDKSNSESAFQTIFSWARDQRLSREPLNSLNLALSYYFSNRPGSLFDIPLNDNIIVTYKDGLAERNVSIPFYSYMLQNNTKLKDYCALRNEKTAIDNQHLKRISSSPLHSINYESNNFHIPQRQQSPLASSASFPPNKVTANEESNIERFEEGSINSLYFKKEHIGMIIIRSMALEDLSAYGKTIFDGVNFLKQKNVSRAIIDMRGNQNGKVDMASLTFKFFFPEAFPYFGKLDMVKTNVTKELTKVMLADSFTTFEDIDSFEPIKDLYGGKTVKKENLDTNWTQPFYRNTEKLFLFGDSSHRKEWEGHQLFAPENLVVVSDGTADSGGAVFIKHVREKKLAKMVGLGWAEKMRKENKMSSAFMRMEAANDGNRNNREIDKNEGRREGEGEGQGKGEEEEESDYLFNLAIGTTGGQFSAEAIQSWRENGDVIVDKDKLPEGYMRKSTDFLFSVLNMWSFDPQNSEPKILDYDYLPPDEAISIFPSSEQYSEESLQKLVDAIVERGVFEKCYEWQVLPDADCAAPDGKENELWGRPCVNGAFDKGSCKFSRCKRGYYLKDGSTCTEIPHWEYAEKQKQNPEGKKHNYTMLFVILGSSIALICVVAVGVCLLVRLKRKRAPAANKSVSEQDDMWDEDSEDEEHPRDNSRESRWDGNDDDDDDDDDDSNGFNDDDDYDDYDDDDDDAYTHNYSGEDGNAGYDSEGIELHRRKGKKRRRVTVRDQTTNRERMNEAAFRTKGNMSGKKKKKKKKKKKNNTNTNTNNSNRVGIQPLLKEGTVKKSGAAGNVLLAADGIDTQRVIGLTQIAYSLPASSLSDLQSLSNFSASSAVSSPSPSSATRRSLSPSSSVSAGSSLSTSHNTTLSSSSPSSPSSSSSSSVSTSCDASALSSLNTQNMTFRTITTESGKQVVVATIIKKKKKKKKKKLTVAQESSNKEEVASTTPISVE
eukprot:MONOS_3476.1-p1 / transcript=MONOS_3476.1 / gene=MONOS_3476 / organism=Monocercomonoides_exilis_PA203 / gene_product=unspecified product / transcript_product=unspecified product / location=Mono_scaffold00082:85096-88017(-) / protein_length=973 / sequence_SO=supercontig / SO=protein_coding / is_pseudo=false